MKKLSLLVMLLLLITTSALASEKPDDRWGEIALKNQNTTVTTYFDKETIEYDANTNILTAWIRMDIPDELRAKYKPDDEKSKICKEFNKVQFNTKERTANIDAEFYGYDKDGNKVFEGKRNKFETIIPQSNIEVIYNAVYGYYKENKLKEKTKKNSKAEDVLRSIINLPVFP